MRAARRRAQESSVSEPRALPIPSGWFALADSDELAPGEVKPVRYFARELVLWRSTAGEARVFDAYCPHLGAHLGHGGRVEDDSLRCPFHAWRFGSDGACVEVPYARRIPPRARVDALPVRERNGAILAWHASDGAPPAFEVPVLAEWGSPEWTAPVRRRYRVRTHAQEMAENVVDPAHFRFVHGTPSLPPTHARIDGHVFRVDAGLTFSTPRGEIRGNVEIASHGMGFGTSRFTGVVETLVVITGAPIDEGETETTLRFLVKRLGNAEAEANVAKAFVAEIDRQYGQDIPIWEHKAHLRAPVLCDGDGPIGLLREWARQFYPAA
jgi:phenylpropionate dioxygenase-like ring-hydroxylating dioxygenase large terminal subunit